MTLPLVSVILPVYNCRRWVADAIRSVQVQNYPNWELVVVDDGSTDGSHEVVERFLHDERIRLIRQQNRGPSAARNTGVSEARGNYVTFLDADDLYLPNSISSRLLPALEKQARVAFSRSAKQVRIDTKIFAHESSTKRLGSAEYTTSSLLDMFINGTFCLGTCDCIVRRCDFLKLGGFDEHLTIHEDVEFMTRLLTLSGIWIETFDLFYIYRRRAGSVSAIDSRAKAREVLRTFAKIRRNLAPWFEQRPERVAEALFARCIQCWPYWTPEHREAMREAYALANGPEIDLARFVGGPKAQAIARRFGWRAGRLASFAATMAKSHLRLMKG